MKIAITGSRGFIGGSFGRFAASGGHEVLGISRSTQPENDWPGHHAHADSSRSDLSAIFREFQADVLLHAAGAASVADSLNEPVEDFRASALTFANVLESVRRAQIQPTIILPSSAAIYGNPRELPVLENAPIAPISPYGFNKAATELLAREYAECFGFNIVIARLFSVFGVRQRRLIVWEIFHQLVDEETVTLQGSGKEIRDFLHVNDVCAAFLQLTRAAAGCVAVNVAGGREISMLDIARTLRAMVAPDKEIICRGLARPGDPLRWVADIQLLQKLAPDWQAHDFNDALESVVEEWQIH